MQRWGKPQAIRSGIKITYQPNVTTPDPIAFYIDSAPQDRRIADGLSGTLTKYGHPQASDLKSAKAVFALISSFKTDTEANPENQVVYPVLVQTAEPSEKLSKVQWIDFRNGLHHLDVIAKLLPEPARLLKALGIRPAGNQLILPPIIQAIVNFLIMIIIFNFSAFILDSLSNNSSIIQWGIGTLIFGLIALLIYEMVKALIQRRGRLASIFGILISFILISILYIPLFAVGMGSYLFSENNSSITSSGLTVYLWLIYIVGMGLLVIYGLIRFKDLWRWFPPTIKNQR